MKKRKDGRFEGKYHFGGKSKSVYGNTKEEVEEKLAKINAEIELGLYFEPSKMKLEDWMKTWLFDYKRNSIKPKTLASYADLIRLHINPAIGYLTLDKLNTIIIQKFINNMKVSPRTIKYVHIVLKMGLKYAVNVGMLIKNPAENISLPRQIKKDIQILDKEDISKFLEEIKNSRYGPVFLLALTTGMRRGEILALRWSDIDFDNATINISRTIDRVKVFDGTNTYCTLLEGDCKTDKSKRVLPILPSALSSLRMVYMRNITEALERGEKVISNSHVFVTQSGKNVSPRNLLTGFKVVLKNAKISHIKFHALRHTFATIGMENGIDIKTMQELLGHSSITITADIYTHVQINQKREAIKKLKQVF